MRSRMFPGSYKEAKMALEVGKIFYADKIIVPYNNLGIGRLIYQLPIPLCQMFMKEVFGEQLPDTFDEETLTTINKFFENNLNVSETSRRCMCIVTRWYIVWKNCKRVPDWTFVCLTMPLPSKSP